MRHTYIVNYMAVQKNKTGWVRGQCIVHLCKKVRRASAFIDLQNSVFEHYSKNNKGAAYFEITNYFRFPYDPDAELPSYSSPLNPHKPNG